jgi:hypothetical protein
MPPQADDDAVDEAAISRSAFAPKTSTNATTSSATRNDGRGDSGAASRARDVGGVDGRGDGAKGAVRVDEKEEDDGEEYEEVEEGEEGEAVEGETAPVDLNALEARLAAEKQHQEEASANVNLLKALGTPRGYAQCSCAVPACLVVLPGAAWCPYATPRRRRHLALATQHNDSHPYATRHSQLALSRRPEVGHEDHTA